jgi:hypothetical protein
LAQRTFNAEEQQANRQKLIVGIDILEQDLSLAPRVLDELLRSEILPAEAIPGMLAEAQNSPETFRQKMLQFKNRLMFQSGQGQVQPKFGRAQAATRDGENVLIQTSPSGVTQEVEGFGPPAAAGDTTGGNIQSVQKGANGNFLVFLRNKTEPIDTGVAFDKNVEFFEQDDGSVVAFNRTTAERMGIVISPEEATEARDRQTRGLGTRALVEAEGARGRVPDATGGFAAVPGTAAAISEEVASRKRGTGALMKSIQAQTVVEDVERLNVLIAADKLPFGRLAAIQAGLHPALQSEGFRNGTSLIESVKGNVGIDSLLRIKQSGAGLGQVPQKQLDLLSRLLGELNLNQSKSQFVRTWERMGTVYASIWNTADTTLREENMIPPEVFQRLGKKLEDDAQEVARFVFDPATGQLVPK